ncbi:MAG: uracil-DNA glycosylase [Dehalococcoidia bacterium]|nr:MAG: uracil-DNA glycosylase [Dehalococcoidia bacterium]
MTTRAEALALLEDRMKDCQKCPLAQTRTRVVPGEGPVDAELVFIGEAPGFNEDRQGRPFVGQAGQLLTELLQSIGLRRQDVYITNIVKCRPPNNRDPMPNEIEACRPWLESQLEVLAPLVICTLGRHSMGRYFKMSISRIHGQPAKFGDVWVMPFFHPAAALHNQALRPALFADFQKLPALLDQARAERRAKSTPVKEPPPEPKQLSLF